MDPDYATLVFSVIRFHLRSSSRCVPYFQGRASGRETQKNAPEALRFLFAHRQDQIALACEPISDFRPLLDETSCRRVFWVMGVSSLLLEADTSVTRRSLKEK